MHEFRPPGSPAGTWPHAPWHVCALHDPYERVNVWSHGLPAVAFLALALVTTCKNNNRALAMFAWFMVLNQGASAMTHTYPDSVPLEKIDHAFIVFNLVGTPYTAMMASDVNRPYADMHACFIAGLMLSALQPIPRTLGYMLVAVYIFFAHLDIVDHIMIAEILLNFVGGLMFMRNGGHERPTGLQDHHVLHYCVTLASMLHIVYIVNVKKPSHPAHPL